MNPFLYNIIITFVGIVYVFAVVGLMDTLVKKYSFLQDVSRKVVHIAAGSWLIFNYLFYTDFNFVFIFTCAIIATFFWNLQVSRILINY